MDGWVKDLLQHCNSLLVGMRVDRWSWWTHWREIADYFLPRRYKWFITANQMNKGSPINQRIIDSTGCIALRTCAAGMLAGITSPARPWFRLTTTDDDLNQNAAVRMWLDEVAKRMLHVFAESNFYTVMHQLYEDLAAFGTAVAIIYEDYDDVIRLYNPCAGEYYLQNGKRLTVDTFAREFVRNMQQITEEFGAANTSADVQTAMRPGSAAQRTREKVIHHIIEKNDGKAPMMGNMPFREVYWEAGAQDKVLRVKGFHEWPVVAIRWDMVSNDAYGRSPGMDALGDQKQLQVEQKRKGQAIDKHVNPPLLADHSLKNEPMSMLPGGVTYTTLSASSMGAKPVFEIRPELGDMREDIKEVQGRIERVFFKDLWLMISELETVRSATEISERKGEKMLMLGPVLERTHSEGLGPIIDRTFAIMWRGKLIPPPPSEMKGAMIKVEYTSILAEAQKSVMTTAVERFVGFVGSIAAGQEGKGGHPDVLDNVEWDQVIDEYAEMLGVPAKLITPIAKVAKIRMEREKQQQQMQQAQNALAAVQGAKVMSETKMGSGQSALSMMTGA